MRAPRRVAPRRDGSSAPNRRSERYGRRSRIPRLSRTRGQISTTRLTVVDRPASTAPSARVARVTATRPRASLGSRRRRTHRWFAFYTLTVIAILVVSVTSRQWSLAGTSLLIALLFALLTRWFWRRR